MNVTRYELLVCNSLIFDLQGYIKVLEMEMNTPKTELESLILEYEWSKSTTKESSHKLLRLGIDRTKLGNHINIYFLRIGYRTRDM